MNSGASRREDVAPPRDIRSVLVLKADKFYACAIADVARRAFPSAAVTLACGVRDAESALLHSDADLLLTGVHLLDGDVFDVLRAWTSAPRRVWRVVVVTGRKEQNVLGALVRLPVDGVFDPSSDEPQEFENALRSVAQGRRYWSASVLAAIEAGTPRPCDLSASLTPTERLVFAVIGDGCDDDTAADRLPMSAATVRSVRRVLHQKLRIKHKGELVCLAAQLGYVCIGAHGVIRPGFSLLLEAKSWRKARRIAVETPAHTG